MSRNSAEGDPRQLSADRKEMYLHNLNPAALPASGRHGPDNERIALTTTSSGIGPVQCRERLGGVPKLYYRDAA